MPVRSQPHAGAPAQRTPGSRALSATGDTAEPRQYDSAASEILLAQLSTGDEQALQALIREYEPLLRRLANGYLRSAWASEAVVQDVFATLWERRTSLAIRWPIAGYLAVATRNRARDLLRQERRRETRDRRWHEQYAALMSVEASGPLAVVSDISRADALATLHHAVALLPTRQQTVYRLRAQQELSFDAIRIAMGAVSVQAVEILYWRTVQRLRSQLAPHTNEGTRRMPAHQSTRGDATRRHLRETAAMRYRVPVTVEATMHISAGALCVLRLTQAPLPGITCYRTFPQQHEGPASESIPQPVRAATPWRHTSGPVVYTP